MLIGDTSKIELEFGCVGFWGEEKTGAPGEKPLGASTRTNNKLNPHMTPGPGVEPGPHWWKASALTTAPSLLPTKGSRVIILKLLYILSIYNFQSLLCSYLHGLIYHKMGVILSIYFIVVTLHITNAGIVIEWFHRLINTSEFLCVWKRNDKIEDWKPLKDWLRTPVIAGYLATTTNNRKLGSQLVLYPRHNKNSAFLCPGS